MTQSESEATLLEQAVVGDSDALSALLAQHGGEVRRAITGAIGQQWRSVLDEDDVMQVTYLEAFLKIGSFKPNGIASFKGWLRRIAENNLQDAIKGLARDKRPNPRNRVRAPVGDESVVALYDLVVGDSQSPSRVAGRNERAAILEETIRRLPPDYQLVLREYDLGGQSAEDVAAKLKRSEGAVYMLRARAMERLRELLPSVSQILSAGA